MLAAVPCTVTRMYGGQIRTLVLEGPPRAMGERHGSELAPEIRGYLADRLDLAGDPYWAGRAEVPERILEIAQQTLEAHERFSANLFDEMSAMAGKAGITVAEAVVVGGFTDLVDVVRSEGGTTLEEDDCTGLIDAERGLLAQTWDMHASAGEYVYLLDVRPEAGPRAFVQTTAGCLGQIGMNEAGVAVGINNLTSYGKPGVTWPFVVRKVLEQTELDDAIKAVLDADLAGGHNFMLMGPDGIGCNIEAMPGGNRVTRVDSGVFAHTNHCLDDRNRSEEGSRSPLSEASSAERLENAEQLAEDLDAFFADEEINRGAATPHDVATCGAVVMRTTAGVLEAVWGRPGEHPWEQFDFE